MKKSTRFVSVLMAAAVTVSLAACGNGDTGSKASDAGSASDAGASADAGSTTPDAGTESSGADDGQNAAPADGKVYNIGILQQLEHPALDSATEGFKDALTELLGEDGVTFEVQNAQGEPANCSSIASTFVSGNCDLILVNATTALQCASAATSTIPVLGTSVTDYATALEIDDWSGATGKNVSGTSDLAPLDQQEDMLLELFPDVKTVGILYCSAEPNSVYQANEFQKYLDEDGIAYKVYTAADSNDINAVVQNAISEVDVIYIPTDNTMANNTETINNITLPAGIPVIAGEEGMCAGCGVATLSISYYDIGYKAGEMAYDILVNGSDITTMNIEYAPNVTKKYNAEICEQLNIQIPDDYTAIETE